MNIKSVPSRLFLCVAEEVTLEEIPAFAGRAIDPLYGALAGAQLVVDGDLHFICPEWKGSFEQKNRLIIGIPVSEEKPVSEPYFVWQAPEFRCAFVDYVGSMPGIKAAWGAVMAESDSQGLKPTGGWREIYKHWESFDSANNVTELQRGIL